MKFSLWIVAALMLGFCWGCSSSDETEPIPTSDVPPQDSSSIPADSLTGITVIGENTYFSTTPPPETVTDPNAVVVAPPPTPEFSAPPSDSAQDNTSGMVFSLSYNPIAQVVDQATEYVKGITDLSGEYDRVSHNMESLQEEYKATMNAWMVARDLAENPTNEGMQGAYNKKMDTLIEIRAEHQREGIPIGPNHIQKEGDINTVATALKSNFDALSDKMAELRNIKGRISERQMKGK